ncbi:MAG TPA: bile acid:sodium symporter family protein [bacterium]|nr:bile acid:sodium symporter family protein [bacterium]HPN43339.1 bile acid:sodium symporter family protein [bacterium]
MDRALNLYNKLFMVWVLIGGVAAFFYPQIFIPLKAYMDWFFALTMLGVGMVMNTDDFVNIFKNYKVVIIGTVTQFTVMPFGAFLVSRLYNLSPDFSLGLILAGSAPGAMASNVISYLAGADVAYSVSLTTVSTFLSPVLTPFLTMLLASTILKVPFWQMFFSVCKMVLIPLLLGLGLKRIFQQKLQPVYKIFPAISSTFIVFICALVIAMNKHYLLQINLIIFLAAITLNVAGLVIGYRVGKFFKMDLLKTRALSIEIGMQNAGLGSVLALKHFNERTALPAVIFVFICIFSASLLVPLWSVKNKTKNERIVDCTITSE